MSAALSDKLVIVIATFLLTTVLGAFWASLLKTSSWKRETKLDMYRKRYNEGTKLLENLSLLIGKRFYAIQRLFWAIRDGQKDRLPELEREYFAVVAKWNARFWLYRNQIRLLVGNQQAERFLDYSDDMRMANPDSVHYCFVQAHRALLKAKELPSEIAAAEKTIELLNHKCSLFLEHLTTDFLSRATSLDLLEMPSTAGETLSDRKGTPQFF
jgi:hypothetical protein